jgi:hypothetical protein
MLNERRSAAAARSGRLRAVNLHGLGLVHGEHRAGALDLALAAIRKQQERRRLRRDRAGTREG